MDEGASEVVGQREDGLQEEIVPKIIDGLETALSEESIGGNAGEMRAGVNAIFFKNEGISTFIFTNNQAVYESHGRHEPDVTFGVKFPGIKLLSSRIEEGREAPPELIDEVIPRNNYGDEAFDAIRRSVIGHNASKIIQYLEKGGSWDDIPLSDFIPTKQQLSDLMTKQ